MKRNDPNLENNLTPPALPQGLSARLAQDPMAIEHFGQLSSAQQRKLVEYVQGAATGPEARARVHTAAEMLHRGEFTL